MTLNNIIPQVKKIFVGRHSEIEELRGLWEFSCQDEEHFVYVFLNAPGIGKTTLINHFGGILESERKGLYIKFVCDNSNNSPLRVNKEILNAIQKAIRQNTQNIENYLSLNGKQEDFEVEREDFQLLRRDLREFLKNPEPDLYYVRDILNRLSNIIPIFFAADEIQEFQKVIFNESLNEKTEKESALHYFTRILKSLLNSKILLILSGTRYHILSQIGFKIGSPIREKVKPIIIRKFKMEDINAYVKQVRELIERAGFTQGMENVSGLLENYEQFLLAFSGGHPRTIENITELFLRHVSLLMIDLKFLNHADFIDYLLPLMEKKFKDILFTKEKENELIELSARAQFSIVKDWIINQAHDGQFLGQVPELAGNPVANDEINDIIYTLMNLGVIVQNSFYNYYITSYFYLLAFLKPLTEPHDLFLKHVLNNKFFKLMCGSHSGFGYSFENIFASAILLHGFKARDPTSIPLHSTKLRSLEVIKGKIEWSKLSLEENILYQTPAAEAIDAFVIQKKELLLIQITTGNPPNPAKIDALQAEMENLSESFSNMEKINVVRSWFVSLYHFEAFPQAHENLLITSGKELIPVLGEQLNAKLREVKELL